MQIALLGAKGKLGTLVCQVLHEQENSPILINRDDLIDQNSFIKFMSEIKGEIVILDVSLAVGTLQLCQYLFELRHTDLGKKILGIIIGTTGHNTECKKYIENISRFTPVCVVSNFSKGIFLFEEILKATTTNGMKVYELARALNFDLGIQEIHHNQKKDAPSGTALSLAEASQIEGSYKISSLRVGKVIGEHTWIASSAFEQLSLNHSADDRKIFALGAVDMCRNIYNKKPAPGLLDKSHFLV